MRWPFLALVALAACGGAPTSTTGATAPTAALAAGDGGHGDGPPIAQVWSARCGGCHRKVEPGTRDRAYLETALGRHRKRVRMNDEQWSAMVDFLATAAAD
jgi:hypothetical protein